MFRLPVAELAVAFVFRYEPEAGGDLGRIEQLSGQGNHTVYQVRLDEILADFAFA